MMQASERIDIQIGQVLRAARKRANLSVAELAKRVNLSTDTILAIEVGAERPSAVQLFQFSCILDIELRSFFKANCGMRPLNPLALIHELRRNPAIASLMDGMRANGFEERAA